MLEQLVGIAKACIRSLLAERRRTARARLRWHVDRHRPSLRGEWEARGVLLLRQWLSPEQLAQYDARSYFEVTGCDSGKRYRISHGTAMNIRELEGDGRARVGWCFVPRGYLVAGDVMLAQKIALETDEHGALAVANKFSVP